MLSSLLVDSKPEGLQGVLRQIPIEWVTGLVQELSHCWLQRPLLLCHCPCASSPQPQHSELFQFGVKQRHGRVDPGSGLSPPLPKCPFLPFSFPWQEKYLTAEILHLCLVQLSNALQCDSKQRQSQPSAEDEVGCCDSKIENCCMIVLCQVKGNIFSRDIYLANKELTASISTVFFKLWVMT